MAPAFSYQRLSCAACDWQQLCGLTEAIAHLNEVGMLRRSAQPSPPLVAELLKAAAPRLTCPQCRAVGLRLAAAETDDTPGRPSAAEARCQADLDAEFDAEFDAPFTPRPAAAPHAAWPQARPCTGCGQAIPRERLELLPEATLCAACQAAAEDDDAAGRPAATGEYCPRCGAPLVLRASRGRGITRYRPVCTGSPPCRLD